MPRLSPSAWSLLFKLPGSANEIDVDVLGQFWKSGLAFVVVPGTPGMYDPWLMETARGLNLKLRFIKAIDAAGGITAVDAPDPLPRGPEFYCGEVAISWVKTATHYRFRFHHLASGGGTLLGTSEFGVSEVDPYTKTPEGIARLAVMHAILTAVVPLPPSALDWVSNGYPKLRKNNQP